MPDDDRVTAWRWQSAAIEAADLLVWTVCENPSDNPGKFTARPHSTRANAPCDFVLVSDTLDAVRGLLPPGLVRLPRDTSDDPVIVETWI
jgi:hypothetical protein